MNKGILNFGKIRYKHGKFDHQSESKNVNFFDNRNSILLYVVQLLIYIDGSAQQGHENSRN